MATRDDAFRALYHREFAFVWATARRFGVLPALLEDAVQDVFLTAHRRLDQLDFEVSARAWLHGVTRRVAARYRRSAGRLTRRLAAVAAVSPGPVDPPQERLAAAQQLERLLARLGGGTRAVFEMAELLGMSGPEIASELGIPVSTVYSRVRLAREQLVRELGGLQLESGVAAARERDTPPPGAAQRAWLVLLPGAAPAGASTALAALATARTAVMTTFVLVVAAGALAWPRTRPATDPAALPPATQPAKISKNPRDFAPAPVVAVELPPVPVAENDPPPGSARLTDADRLAAEVALLDRARAALARGAADTAQAHLAEHARRFPAGALADLRQATEVEVLCHLGQPGDAAARAAALVAMHPRSAVAQRFADFSCPR